MPEEETTPAAEATETETPEATPEAATADEVAKWKALARKNEEQAKKNADAAKKLEELEDAQKSEADKLKDRLATLENEASTSTLEATRLRVALRKGLNETLAKRLEGETEEELEADADELLTLLKPSEADDSVTPPRRPQERLRPGATPSGSKDALNGDPLLRDLKSKLGIR